MAESTFTFRIDDELKKQFAEIAKSKDRTAAQLVREFIRDTIARKEDEAEYDAWLLQKIQTGLDDAAAGRVHSSEKVEAYFKKRRAEILAKVDENA